MKSILRFTRLSLTALVLSVFAIGSAQAINPTPSPTTDTMIIGDSVFALSGDIHRYLEQDLN